MSVIEFEFDEFNFKGAAYKFSQATIDRYVDESFRNGDDAAQGVLARQLAEPPFEEVQKARRRFPLMAQRVCDLLCEAAGYAGQEAVFQEPLTTDAPPGILGMAGLSQEDAENVLRERADDKLEIVIVRDGERRRLFACVIRPDEEALRLLRGEQKKGYAKLCRSAALASIVWSIEKPEDAFERWPAIPAFVLGPLILKLGGAGATRRFRDRS